MILVAILEGGGQQMFKRCLVFILTILCLAFSLGCGSDDSSAKWNRVETPVNKVEQPVATTEQSESKNYVSGSFAVSDVKVSYWYDYDSNGHLAVLTEFKIKNISQRPESLNYMYHFLRKKGHNSFEANLSNSGFKRVSTEKSLNAVMKLFPGDEAIAVMVFKTDIKEKNANGWYVNRYATGVENVLFVIDETMNTGKNIDLTKEQPGKSSSAGVEQTNKPPVASAPAKSSAPSNGSAEALKDFHYAISMKKYKDAYQYLGPEMQQYVGGYDKFVQGYQTTVYSVVRSPYIVSNDGTNAVIKYTIQAKDRTSSGDVLQDFSAESKLTKINGRWRIVDTRARKVS